MSDVTIEAERDELRAEVERLTGIIEGVRAISESAVIEGQPDPHDGFAEGLDHGASIQAEHTLRILNGDAS